MEKNKWDKNRTDDNIASNSIRIHPDTEPPSLVFTILTLPQTNENIAEEKHLFIIFCKNKTMYKNVQNTNIFPVKLNFITNFLANIYII